jgi:hypothetical protein
VPEEAHAFGRRLFAYEATVRPVCDSVAAAEGMKSVNLFGREYYVRENCLVLRDSCQGGGFDLEQALEGPVTLYYQTGFSSVIDNHEVVLEYSAKTMEQLIRGNETRHRTAAMIPPPVPPDEGGLVTLSGRTPPTGGPYECNV